MSFHDKKYPVLDFVDDLDGNNHTILLYDKEIFRKLVQYQFLLNGLKKGENCVFVTHDDVKIIEDEMVESGIDVEYYQQKGLLHIHQIENILDYEGGIRNGFERVIKRVTSSLEPPIRLTGRVVPEISTRKGIVAELLTEEIVHNNPDIYKGYILCVYKIDDIEESERKVWLNQLLRTHANVIYATVPEKAVAFKTELVTKAEFL